MRLTRWEVLMLCMTLWLICVDLAMRFMTWLENRRARRWNHTQQQIIRLRNSTRKGKL